MADDMYYSRTFSCMVHEACPRRCRGLLFLGLLLWMMNGALAQHAPYQVSQPLDLSLSLGGLAVSSASYLLSRQIEPLSSLELSLQNQANILRIDRSAANAWRPGIAKASDVLLYTGILSPTLLLTSKRIRADAKTQLWMSVETFLLTFSATQTTKIAVLRARPFTYISTSDPTLTELQQEADARFSFFSGHTSMTASMCWYTASVFDTYFPESKARPFVWGAAASLPAVVGWMRVRSGKHFLTDVITGYAVGAAIGWLIPRLHRKK